jgi:glycopeptide antibiotics resistance protein
MGFLMPFCFQALIKGKQVFIGSFLLLLLETAPKTQNI